MALIKYLASGVSVFVILFSVAVIAHGDEGSAEEQTSLKISDPERKFSEVNASYIQNVKEIFKSKCFDCHSRTTVYPWYYSIPGVKQFIDHDIEEGLEHLDLSNDFPFAGHGDPLKDLEEIKEVVEEKSMPPFLYRLMHRESSLSEAERQAVLGWVDQSVSVLNQNNP